MCRFLTFLFCYFRFQTHAGEMHCGARIEAERENRDNWQLGLVHFFLAQTLCLSRNGNSTRALARTLSPQMSLFTISCGLYLTRYIFTRCSPFCSTSRPSPLTLWVAISSLSPLPFLLALCLLFVLFVLPVCFRLVCFRPVLAVINHATILFLVTKITRTVFLIALDAHEINAATTECGVYCRLNACCSK